MKPFDSEIVSYFGLRPVVELERPANICLHECYPPDLYPLRRDHAQKDLLEVLSRYRSDAAFLPRSVEPPPMGEVFLPVGPIHAGVIEPGQFLFRIGSETIEALDIRLGYTHKGIERLFQTRFNLQDGWRLAEQVSGDSSFAHSMAYCQATEALARVSIPYEANLLRGLFLELERLANHIGDSAALAHDVALEMIASEIAVLREEIMRLNGRLTCQRFLRGLNRPGGVVLPQQLDVDDARRTVSHVTNRYLEMAQLLVELNDFRERTINIGILPKATALALGITGLAARASGVERDFRLQHPYGPYSHEETRRFMSDQGPSDLPLVMLLPMTGDVFSRFLIRAREVSHSARLIEHFLGLWPSTSKHEFMRQIDFMKVPNFEYGLGYAEGWRGDVVYWVMKDKLERIYRCKVRDPSILNWPGLKAAIEPHEVNGQWFETTVVDFPIVNKSFNLSYSGNDL
jgi:Ni,Fe-hydrogenase III large subunit